MHHCRDVRPVCCRGESLAGGVPRKGDIHTPDGGVVGRASLRSTEALHAPSRDRRQVTTAVDNVDTARHANSADNSAPVAPATPCRAAMSTVEHTAGAEVARNEQARGSSPRPRLQRR